MYVRTKERPSFRWADKAEERGSRGGASRHSPQFGLRQRAHDEVQEPLVEGRCPSRRRRLGPSPGRTAAPRPARGWSAAPPASAPAAGARRGQQHSRRRSAQRERHFFCRGMRGGRLNGAATGLNSRVVERAGDGASTPHKNVKKCAACGASCSSSPSSTRPSAGPRPLRLPGASRFSRPTERLISARA